MAHQLSSPLHLQNVPAVTSEVVVTCEENATALAVRYGSDPTDNMFASEPRDLLVGSDVEHAARRVVATCRKVHPIGHEGDGVDV